MSLKRRSLLTATMIAVILGGSAGLPTTVFALSCAGGSVSFAGNKNFSLDHPKGTASDIQAKNPSLCTGTAATFSSSWIAIEGGAVAPGYNILQIGYDKCRDSALVLACGDTSPQSTFYHLWAYGRNPNQGCGAQAVEPTPIFIAGTPSGTPRFKIERGTSTQNYDYRLYINDVLKASKPQSALENCWTGGTVRSTFFNEVFDDNTQSGGNAADKQDYVDVRWKTDAWYLFTRPLGANCDTVQRASQRCITSTVDSNNYYSWDASY